MKLDALDFLDISDMLSDEEIMVQKTTKEFCNGKVVSILEGGYDLNALAESANEHVNALLEFD